MSAWASYRRIFRAVERCESVLVERPGAILADRLSPGRVDFGSEGFLEGKGLRYRLAYRFRILPLLLRTGREARRSYMATAERRGAASKPGSGAGAGARPAGAWAAEAPAPAPPAPPARRAPQELFRELERFARAHGVDEVGYTVLSPSDLFRGKAAPYPGVIVLAREMDAVAVSRAPSFETLRMIHATYFELGRATNRIAAYLRERGHAAEAGPALGGVSVYPLLGARAGLGAVGRHGLLITPRFGPRQRLSVIYTGIENLPEQGAGGTRTHEWISEYCDACRLCQNVCPGQAILPEPESPGSGRRRYIDSARCLPQVYALDGCSWCIRECPFSRTPFESLRREFLEGRGLRLY